jgi:hypothetical protein
MRERRSRIPGFWSLLMAVLVALRLIPRLGSEVLVLLIVPIIPASGLLLFHLGRRVRIAIHNTERVASI